MGNKCGVVGHPITHSLSPKLHQHFAKMYGIELDYEAIDVPRGKLAEALLTLQRSGFKGCNITAPHKEAAFILCEPSQAARLAESVNCLTLTSQGKILGDNFDGVGLISDLQQQYPLGLKNRTIAIIGAGGAVRGILGPLLAEHPKHVIILNRTPEKASALVNAFQHLGHLQSAPLSATLPEPVELLIHATADATHFTADTFPLKKLQHTFCYDLNYGEKALPFLTLMKTLGARQTTDGFGMLVAQAAASFERWFGIFPHTLDITADTL